MRVRKNFYVIIGLALATLFFVAEVSSAKVVVCESEGKRYRFCEVEVTGPVKIIKQLSDAPCVEGQTWGYDRYGIWVTNGCRAKFEIEEYGGETQVRRISCESEKMRYQYCPVSGVVSDVRLIKQFSKKPCIQGDSWGFDRNGVWVDKGCRGEFAVYQRRQQQRYDLHPGYPGYPSNVPIKRKEW